MGGADSAGAPTTVHGIAAALRHDPVELSPLLGNGPATSAWRWAGAER